MQIKSLFRPKVYALIKDMEEPKPLPLGAQEFEEWSNRIIAKAMIPGVTPESQKFALADFVLHLNSTEDHKPDGYFIKHLRKVCVNQVCDFKRKQMKSIVEQRAAKEMADKEAAKLAVTPNEGAPDVLQDQKV